MATTITNNSLFPIFVFTGDTAVAVQIQAYCQRWYESSSAASTYINVVYLADVMPIYAVPNARVYKVTRTPNGFELTLMFDFIDAFVGNVKPVAAFWPTVYDEAYWWEWIDAISADDPSIIYTTLNPLEVGQPGNIPILTPNGFEPTPYNDIIPTGVNAGGCIGNLPYNWVLPGEGWSFAGLGYYSYQWQCDFEEYWWAEFPNLIKSYDVGGFMGLSVINGGQNYGRISSAKQFFNNEHGVVPSYCGGAHATICIETSYDVYIPENRPQQGNWYLGAPKEWNLSALSSSYDFAAFSITTELRHAPDTYPGSSYDKRTVADFIIDHIDLPHISPPSFQYQYLSYFFERSSKGLCEMLPFLPPFVPPVEFVPPASGVIPPFIGGLLGGMMTQTTQAIMNLLLIVTPPGRKEGRYGRH